MSGDCELRQPCHLLQGVQEDIKTLQMNVKSINSIAKSFIEDSDPDFSVSVRMDALIFTQICFCLLVEESINIQLLTFSR